MGATKLDRPEWVAVNPLTSEVFVTLTNGGNVPNPVNPRKPNPYGSILRLREPDGDHEALTFGWDVFMLAGDPQYDASVGLHGDDVFGSPDGLAVDPDGRLWIATDVSNSSLLKGDKGYDRIGNNQLLAADPRTGDIRRFLGHRRAARSPASRSRPTSRRCSSMSSTRGKPPRPSVPATLDNPRKVSNWPDFDPAGRPRAATVVIRRPDGGTIGT